MFRRSTLSAALLLSSLVLAPVAAHAEKTLAQRITHTDPQHYNDVRDAHGGTGAVHYMELCGNDTFTTNLMFIHRGLLMPKSSIGHHFHNHMEEMYLILNGEAQFTIDGRTALLKGPAGAPCRMGHSHAIYNPTDIPVEWMNIGVTAIKGRYDNFDLGDPRNNARLDETPVFINFRLDKKLLKESPGYEGGKGTILYRRALTPEVFLTNWDYIDHILIPDDATIGPTANSSVDQCFYVLSGNGTVSVNGETSAIKSGDAIPVRMNDRYSIESAAPGDLELMVIGVAKSKWN